MKRPIEPPSTASVGGVATWGETSPEHVQQLAVARCADAITELAKTATRVLNALEPVLRELAEENANGRTDAGGDRPWRT